MNESSKTPLGIAFVVVIALFLIFGGGAMTGSMMGGGMMGQGWIGGYRMGQGWISGGFSWMWIPYFTYPRSRRPTWLGDLREEVTRVSLVATTLLLVISITEMEKEKEDECSATTTFKIRIQ